MAQRTPAAGLSLQAKLLSAFALLFALVLGGGTLAWYSSYTIKSQQDLTEAAARRLQLAQTIAATNAEIFGAEKNMILGGITNDSSCSTGGRHVCRNYSPKVPKIGRAHV